VKGEERREKRLSTVVFSPSSFPALWSETEREGSERRERRELEKRKSRVNNIKY